MNGSHLCAREAMSIKHLIDLKLFLKFNKRVPYNKSLSTIEFIRLNSIKAKGVQAVNKGFSK